MSEIKELLAVLDLPEEEQVEFFYIKGYRHLVDTFPAGGLRIKYDEDNKIISVKHSQSKLRFDRRALADLAFRMRDEICKDSLTCDNYQKALRIIYRSFCKSQEGTSKQNMIPYTLWLESFIVPMERIIAALLAKQKEKA